MGQRGRTSFSSLNDLETYYGEVAATETLQSIALLVTQFAQTLKKNLQRHIDAYYASYSPSKYGRTGNLKKSLDNTSFHVSQSKAKNGVCEMSCELSFDEDMAKSASIFGKEEYEGNRVDLIQGGWQVKKDVRFKNIEHFGFQKAYDFIGKALNDTFAQVDTQGIIDVQVSGARNVKLSKSASGYVHVE